MSTLAELRANFVNNLGPQIMQGAQPVTGNPKTAKYDFTVLRSLMVGYNKDSKPASSSSQLSSTTPSLEAYSPRTKLAQKAGAGALQI